MSASYWGSLLPAAWSMMLALRSRGLGSAWTTLHLLGDGEKQAAEILGIPFDTYAQGGLFPIGYTTGTDFKRAKRLPAEQLTHWNSW
jgi:nitroreductase